MLSPRDPRPWPRSQESLNQVIKESRSQEGFDHKSKPTRPTQWVQDPFTLLPFLSHLTLNLLDATLPKPFSSISFSTTLPPWCHPS